MGQKQSYTIKSSLNNTALIVLQTILVIINIILIPNPNFRRIAA